MQHFDAGNYHLINIHKCLFINVQLLQENCMEIIVVQFVIEAAMELRLLFNFLAFLKLYLMLFWASINFS